MSFNKSILALTLLSSTCVFAAGVEMRPRPTNPDDIPDYVNYLIEVSVPRNAEEIAKDAEVKERYKDVLNLDSLFIGAPGFPAGFSNEMFEEYTDHSKDNEFDGLSLTISNGSDKSVEETMQRMKYTNKYINDHSDKFMHITEIADFEKARESGRLGIHYNFQSMNAFGDDISNIEKYYNLGLRQANFTYNKDNAYGGGGISNGDGSNDGVSQLGMKAIDEMNRVGMIIDCSHSSNQTCIEAAVLSSKPVIMSHSNVGILHPIDRNVSDPAMKAVAATGGVICTNFIGGFLNKQGMAQPSDIAKHVNYVKNLVGVEATCSGSDYVYNLYDLNVWILNNPDQFPPEMGYASPSQLGMPGEVWGVVRILEDRYQWTEKEIEMFLGGNLMRVYEDNWAK